ncbi:CBS domain protein [Necator americanus]|uniref:CBS domain protein n=1 Tax=Necator americanus TaxID=51031 RepID=W2T3L8_NECAM|nr:CBS domain protein [Necator americanus]ETN76149.1 CBS domain protein [Necator americanus]
MEDLRRIKEYDENPKTRRYAANIIPIRENGNFMLCTILIGNTICNAIDVLTFDRITLNLDLLDWERILLINIVPAMFIIIFSEIIPQVICTKYALPIGSRCRHLMVFFMVITYPASYPLSKVLDWVVGKEARWTMDRRMLGSLMRQQKNETANMAAVVENAMMLQVKRVKDVMTPLEKVFMMSDRTEVNLKLKQQLSENRHTRIPVYKGDDRNCVIGVLNVKDLLLIDESLDVHVGAIMQLWHRSALFRFVTSESPVVQLMLELKKGIPLAIVVDYQYDKKCYHVTGIVTLEDNLEEVIGEINDEKDVVGSGVIASEYSKDAALRKTKKRIISPSQEDLIQDENIPLLNASATFNSAEEKETFFS